MASYLYRAKNTKGEDRKGFVEAKDEKQALAVLRERGLVCYSLKEKRDDIITQTYKKLFQRVSITETATFTRQLSTMINAGLPLTEALTILKNQTNPLFGEVVGNILRDVEGGLTLADAMKKHPQVFSRVYIALIRAGESAGVLDTILLRLADNLESQREFQTKIKGAMMYPLIIFVGMIVVMAIMMIFVVPKLTSLYKEFDAELPQITQILIGISTFMVTWGWMFLPLIPLAGYIYRLIYNTPNGRKRIDELKFRLPIAGNLQRQVAFAELTRTLALLIGAGVSLVEALEISSKVSNNSIIEDSLANANKLVEKGYPLASALSQYQIFPPILSQMLSVGEETGKIDEVLMKISKYFQSDSEEALKGLTSALEPLIMIVLGVGVGFLIIAVILPIYNLTNTIK